MQTPISRDELRALKAGEDEKKRIEDINRWVSFVYRSVPLVLNGISEKI